MSEFSDEAELAPPNDDDVLRILARAASRIMRMKESIEPGREADDDDERAMAVASDESMEAERNREPCALGQRAEIVRKTGRRAWLCAGFSLHADTFVPSGQRDRLEHLLRYGARPAFAQSCLSYG